MDVIGYMIDGNPTCRFCAVEFIGLPEVTLVPITAPSDAICIGCGDRLAPVEAVKAASIRVVEVRGGVTKAGWIAPSGEYRTAFDQRMRPQSLPKGPARVISLYRIKCVACGTCYENAPEFCSCGCQYGVYEIVDEKGGA